MSHDDALDSLRECLEKMERRRDELVSEVARKRSWIASSRGGGAAHQESAAGGEATTENRASKNVSLQHGIKDQNDLKAFMESKTCEILLGFLSSLNECAKHDDAASRTNVSSSSSSAGKGILAALKGVNRLLDETPPQDPEHATQRFGNRAFREFHEKLTRWAPSACAQFFELGRLREDEFTAYLTGSFGDPKRLDYGTGHEASFLFLMFALNRARIHGLEELVGEAFPAYLALVRRVRSLYRLEPAGSHGVWSLDDYHFLPFVFGSAQAAGRAAREKSAGSTVAPREVREFIALSGGTGRGAEAVLAREPTRFGGNMYFEAVADILTCKRGPFQEHSPFLYELSGFASWEDVNQGLMRMYAGEVLGKFPVAQHFWFGESLPITWAVGGGGQSGTARGGDHNTNGMMIASALGTGFVDPLAKYFRVVSSSGSTLAPRTGNPPSAATETVADVAGGRTISYTLLENNEGIVLPGDGWRLEAHDSPRIANEEEIELIRAADPALDFPLPEMLFPENRLVLRHEPSGVVMSFRTAFALRDCKLAGGTPRTGVEMAVAEKWARRTDAEGKPIPRWRDDFDWTFTTHVHLECAQREARPTPRRIDYERLKVREQILWSREVVLFEDDLFDAGEAKLTVKVRVMPSCFFALARFFLRLDGSYLRVCDTRVFHVFGTKHVLVETSKRESAMRALPPPPDERSYLESNYVASILPLVGEPVTREIALGGGR